MISVSAFKWGPPFAKGQVRDHRVRWVLNEVGWPYRMRLIDSVDQQSDVYRAEQPFGQVPVMAEDGRPTLFESGAIVLDVALRSGRLLPEDDGQRGLALSYYFAALNSVEPFLSNVAEVEFFMADEAQRQARRPAVRPMAEQRLAEVQRALGGRAFLVADQFTIADLMMASVLLIARSLKLMDAHPELDAWHRAICERPAFRKAIDDQCAELDAHEPRDMKFPEEVLRMFDGRGA